MRIVNAKASRVSAKTGEGLVSDVDLNLDSSHCFEESLAECPTTSFLPDQGYRVSSLPTVTNFGGHRAEKSMVDFLNDKMIGRTDFMTAPRRPKDAWNES